MMFVGGVVVGGCVIVDWLGLWLGDLYEGCDLKLIVLFDVLIVGVVVDSLWFDLCCIVFVLFVESGMIWLMSGLIYVVV